MSELNLKEARMSDLSEHEKTNLEDVQVGDVVMFHVATDRVKPKCRETEVITTTDEKFWVTHKNGAPYGPWIKKNGCFGGDGFPGFYRRITA